MGGVGTLPFPASPADHMTISLEDVSQQNRGDSLRGVSKMSPGGAVRSGVAPIPFRSTLSRKRSLDLSPNSPWGSPEILKVGLSCL